MVTLNKEEVKLFKDYIDNRKSRNRKLRNRIE